MFQQQVQRAFDVFNIQTLNYSELALTPSKPKDIWIYYVSTCVLYVNSSEIIQRKWYNEEQHTWFTFPEQRLPPFKDIYLLRHSFNRHCMHYSTECCTIYVIGNPLVCYPWFVINYCLLQVVIVGNGAVGKSSMIQKYCKGIFTAEYKKTIGVDFLEKRIW